MKFRLSAWAIRNPVPVAVSVLALTIVGLMCFSVLPIKSPAQAFYELAA